VTEDDLHELGRWLHAQKTRRLDAWAFLVATLLTEDDTCLTYAISDGDRAVLVRRSAGDAAATADDLAHEQKVTAALAGAGAPVPACYGLCADASVLGGPFSVFERPAGASYPAQAAALGPDGARAIAERAVDALASLHAVDPRVLGDDGESRSGDSVERRLHAVKQSLDSRRDGRIDGADELHARLERSLPAPVRTTIAHGAYRAENLLVDDDGRLTAVLGWQRTALGDPLTDVAELAVSVGDETIERYAARTGRDLKDLGFHLGLAYLAQSARSDDRDVAESLIERGLAAAAG